MWEPPQGHMGRTHSSLGFVPGDTRIKGRGAGGAVRGVGKHTVGRATERVAFFSTEMPIFPIGPMRKWRHRGVET